MFTIDANTGIITTAAALDYESAVSHSITVLATSNDASTSSRIFTITVTDVNDAPVAAADPPGNRPERLEWFRDLGFGLFIHWSLDSQVTSVISHSMVGASEDYLERYLTELPRSFNPERFQPREWARLARLAGFTYVVFTAKHHSGFCMFETRTTDFSIMNTPYGRDATRELVEAFRAEGLAEEIGAAVHADRHETAGADTRRRQAAGQRPVSPLIRGARARSSRMQSA